MEKEKPIDIAIKFAEIDNMPSEEQEGWVNGFVGMLEQTLVFYFRRPVTFRSIKATEAIGAKDFNTHDAIIYILSPAFIFSSNINTDISGIEKACFFNTDLINAKIFKVLKGPVKPEALPVTISMGRYYYFYQTASLTDSLYETLSDRDSAPLAHSRYWESLTSLAFDLLKQLGHEKHERFLPSAEQTVFLGNGGMDQLWNRSRLLGELNARGVHILPDHDYSVEVKHLKEPAKFYLRKSNLAVYFPEEFIPLNEQRLQELADLSELKRLIWFDPEAEKDLEKKKQYDELKLQLRNMEHVEAISAGLEELKEIIFAAAANHEAAETAGGVPTQACLYLICAHYFEEELKRHLIKLLEKFNLKILLPGNEAGNEKRSRHYEYLKQADYSLICYDGKNPEWIRANINEVMKAAGLHAGKKKQIRPCIINGSAAIGDELAEYAGTIAVIDASSPTLAEELNDYVNGR